MNQIKLFRLLQLTRAMPMIGYVTAEVPRPEIGNLAEHHYLVTFISWMMAREIIKKGGKLNLNRVLEIALIHDLGELFGGDIGASYARVNPPARKAAKAFERENLDYLTQFFGEDEKYIKKIFDEMWNKSSDEAKLVSIADWVECTQYKKYVRRFSDGDIVMAEKKFYKLIEEIKDKKTQKVLKKFTKDWAAGLRSDDGKEIFEHGKYA